MADPIVTATAAGMPADVCWGPEELAGEEECVEPAPLVQDLLSLIRGVYMLLALEAGADNTALRATVPVRDPARWEPLATELQRLLFRITQRRLVLEFTRDVQAPGRLRLPAAVSRADSVVIFGASLSSLAGTLSLLREGRRPLLVIDRPRQPHLSTASERALQVVQQHHPGTLYLTPTLDAATRLLPPQRHLHSLRSIGLAIALAELLHLPRVYLYEDAASALGLFEPLAAPERNPRHPANVCDLNDLLRAGGYSCRLVNPFILRTPFEVAQHLLRPQLSSADLDHLPPLADDCGGGSCGACLPQQLALRMLAGEAPPPEGGALAEGCAPDNAGLVDLLLCTLDLCDRSDVDLIGRFPSLLHALRGAGDLEIVPACRRSAVQARALLQQYWPEAAKLLG